MSAIGRGWRMLCGAFVLVHAAVAAADSPTVWNFDNPAAGLASALGPGVMVYHDPGFTNWGPTLTSFGNASDLNLPLLPNGQGGFADGGVMCFPKTSPSQGYAVVHNTSANGVHAPDGDVSNYTLVWDIYWPAASDGKWRSFFQTNVNNANDGDFFALNAPGGGVGISGRYQGSLPPGEWHRVAMVVRAAGGGPRGLRDEGQMHKYIDGVFVGGQGTTGSGITSRWSLDPTFYLFTDDSNDTQAGCVASVMYIDRNLSMDEVAALGGVNALGANVPGFAPPPITRTEPRRVDIIAHRGMSCCAPENTLASLDLAFNNQATHAEIDIHRTSDGVAILFHDDAVERTTNGTGAVAAKTLAEVKQLDAGSWFGAEFAGTKVPTLAEAMALAKGRGKLYLDIKQNGLGPSIAAAMNEANFAVEDLWMWHYGGNAETIALRQVIPEARIIYEPAANWATTPNYFADLKAIGVWGFDKGSGTGAVDPAFVQAAHAAGMYVAAYTILDPVSMHAAIANGVDGMETDFPHILDALMPDYGDADLSGAVDPADYNIWLANFGQCGRAWGTGNFTAVDSCVTGADYTLWADHYSLPGAAAVPEPSSMVLAVLGLVVVALAARRRG